MAKGWLVSAFVLLIAAATPGSAQVAVKAGWAFGQVQNGVYHHNRTGIEFSLPPDWVVVSQEHASSGAQTVLLRDTLSNQTGLVWLKARTIDVASIPAVMNRRLDSKVAQRNNFQGYTFRADSVRQTTIGGKPALSAVANYVQAGRQMVEYITWIDGEKSRAVFSVRLPTSELPGFQSRFDAIVQSAMVP